MISYTVLVAMGLMILSSNKLSSPDSLCQFHCRNQSQAKYQNNSAVFPEVCLLFTEGLTGLLETVRNLL